MKYLSSHKLLAALAFAGLLSAPEAMANATTFTATGDGGRAASVNFDSTGGTLTVTLTNTATYDAMAPTDILTAVYFNLNNAAVLTPVSAIVPAGNSTFDGGNAANLATGPVNVGGEWAYGGGINISGANRGISSTGLGVFGAPNFNGPNLQDPAALNGVEYGITTATDVRTTGNGGITGQQLIQNVAVFTLTGLPADYDVETITNVRFQYGTNLSEPQTTPGNGVPDGGQTLILLGLGLSGIALTARLLKRGQSPALASVRL